MNEQLIVKNFGPIKDATVDFKRVTVFIGPTGGGKSTLAKLAAVFRGYLSFLSRREVGKLFSDYGIKNYFTETSSIDWISFPSRLTYLDNNWRTAFHSTIRSESSEARKLIAEVTEELNSLKALLEDESKTNEYKDRVISLKEKQNNVEHFVKQYAAPSKPHYIPAERILLSTLGNSWPDLVREKSSLPSTMIAFARNFLEARKEIQMLSVESLGVAYLFTGGYDQISIDNHKTLMLSETASGIQSVTPVLVLLEHLSRNTEQAQSFIVEEPELNLYPTAQQGLLNWLVEKCTKGENDLTITTHSPYILSSCNLLLEAYKVAKLRPDLEDEIAAIVPKACWLNPDEFAAYYVADGTVKPITDERTHLIGGNELDSVSGDISDSFRKLLRLKKQVA
jgi:predicted ATPase